MKEFCFSRIEDDIYMRRYTISQPFIENDSVIICAMCSKNAGQINNHEYFLEVFFSVGEYGDLEFLSGITFGEGRLDKKALDVEIDKWVEHFAQEDSFPQLVSRYLKRMELYEEWSECEGS